MTQIACGSTEPGNTAWELYCAENTTIPKGIFVDVDTSSGHFSRTPVYVTSLGGVGSHWDTVGATSIYLPTPKSFRVYLKWTASDALTPDIANQQMQKFTINWIGMEAEKAPSGSA